MKPRYRPGKPATSGSAARASINHAKPLSQEQLQHLRQESIGGSMAPKAGRGGKRAHWNIDYAEGVECDQKSMPCKEPDSISTDGVRRFGKRGK